jgi:SAM-dependent methyltransferase
VAPGPFSFARAGLHHAGRGSPLEFLSVHTLVAGPQAPLLERYTEDAVGILDAAERGRLFDAAGMARDERQLAWELLYRIEPALYAELVAGERLHDGILRWLPAACDHVLEIGAGTGRLTLDLARRSVSVTAVEPALPMHDLLRDRLRRAGADRVQVVRGFFDELPAGQRAHDLVISCSAFAQHTLADPDGCLDMMQSRCAPGGLLVIVWPWDAPWLRSRGFEHVVFEGPMVVEYESLDSAIALARIFYPHAVATIAARGSRFVDYTDLGLNAPRDLCWKRCG